MRDHAFVVKILVIVTGVRALFYALVTVTEFLVAGQAGEMLASRRTQRMIDDLSDHIIICGFGRVGRQVARDLRAAGTPQSSGQEMARHALQTPAHTPREVRA